MGFKVGVSDKRPKREKILFPLMMVGLQVSGQRWEERPLCPFSEQSQPTAEWESPLTIPLAVFHHCTISS